MPFHASRNVSGMLHVCAAPNSTPRRRGWYGQSMVLARFRRCAWLLVLVLVAGLGTPVFASGTAHQPTHGTMTHVHADGSAHRHAVRADGRDGAAVGGLAKQTTHCSGCLMDADCAVSCLGMAVLPMDAGWSLPAFTTAWTSPAAGTPVGVVLPGEADPPRPVPVR